MSVNQLPEMAASAAPTLGLPSPPARLTGPLPPVLGWMAMTGALASERLTQRTLMSLPTTPAFLAVITKLAVLPACSAAVTRGAAALEGPG